MADPNRISQHFSNLQIPKPTLQIHHSPPILWNLPIPFHNTIDDHLYAHFIYTPSQIFLLLLLLLHNPNTNHGVRWVLAARWVDLVWNWWVWWTSWGTACLGVIARGVTIWTQMGVLVFLRWMSWIWGTGADRVVGAGWSVRISWLSKVFQWGWRLWGIDGKVGVYTLFLVRFVKYVY